MQKKKKLYVIGIDSAALWILEGLKGKKGMEAFDKLLEGKHMANLESTLLPVTAASWPSIYTGLEPYRHGVPEFLVMTKDYVPDVRYFDPNGTKPFYYRLAELGFKTLVVTPAMDVKLPPKYIDDKVDIITGFPLGPRTNSRVVEAAMKKCGFVGEPDIEKKLDTGQLLPEKAISQYMESVDKRVAVVKELEKVNNYDLVYVCFTETDRIQHFLMKSKKRNEYFLSIYSRISSYLECLINKIGKEGGALMIVSDHGAQPIDKMFLINAWLIGNGFAKLKKSMTVESKPNDKDMRDSIVSNDKARGIYDRMPYFMKKVAFSIFEHVLPSSARGTFPRILPSDFVMEDTQAFGAISVLPVFSVWINDNRFVKGHVRSADVGKLKTELIQKLRRIKTDEGKNLVEFVEDGRKYYKNTEKFVAADLLVGLRPGFSGDPYHISNKTLFMNASGPRNGDHTKYGIFGFYTNDKIYVNTKGISVLEIAPTILDYFGVKAADLKKSRLKR